MCSEATRPAGEGEGAFIAFSMRLHRRQARSVAPGFILALSNATPIIPRVLDIKLIREKPDFVKERLKARGAGDEAVIDKILPLDESRRKALPEVETLKAQRNRVSKEIGV